MDENLNKKIEITVKTKMPVDLAIGSSNFCNLINNNYIYVDKTEMIHDLLTSAPPFYILARPRRFGKSLLLSTMQQVLLGRSELFKNLFIGNPDLKYPFQRSHVIRLDMADYANDPKNLDANLARYLRYKARNFGIRLKSDTCENTLKYLLETLYNSYPKIPLIIDGQSVIPDTPSISVLIDEYDSPIVNNLIDSKKAELARVQLQPFFNTLKRQVDFLNKVFITGITSFTKYSIFSSMNNLCDITNIKQYATICGFTEDEILKYFDRHLTFTLKLFRGYSDFGPNFTQDDLFKEIKFWYDGYCFDGESKVINPQSFLSFLWLGKLSGYWYETGGSTHIKQLNTVSNYFGSDLDDLDESSLFTDNDNGRFNPDRTVELETLDKVSQENILIQAGYLTIIKQDPTKMKSRYFLAIPNKEIRDSIKLEYFNSQLLPKLKRGNAKFYTGNYLSLYMAFCKLDNRLAEEILSRLFSSLPSNLHNKRESFYHLLMYFFFRDLPIDIFAERPSSGGRTDLVLRSKNGKILFVIEIKYRPYPVKPKSKNAGRGSYGSRRTKWDRNGAIKRILDNGIVRAFNQILERRYVQPYLKEGQTVYAVAVSICGREHAKVAFKLARFKKHL
jgi:hypothetical protein